MADILSLRLARKAARRRAAEADAAANRVAHGTPKVLRERETAQRALTARRLEGHRREGDGTA